MKRSLTVRRNLVGTAIVLRMAVATVKIEKAKMIQKVKEVGGRTKTMVHLRAQIEMGPRMVLMTVCVKSKELGNS